MKRQVFDEKCALLTRNSPPVATPARVRESRWTHRPTSGLMMVLLIVAIWIVVALLIDPRGEFPRADDWAYSAAVKTLLGGGGIKLSGWIGGNLIAQIFWGALFCLPFGFSFTALRISTLTLGLIGALAVYGLLREGDADHTTALFGALLLAFNPLYLVLSYTFMSDVPFVAVSTLSFYVLVRGMRKSSGVEMAAGLLLACLALLIRQTGLAIFMGFGVAYLTKYGLRLRKVFLATVHLQDYAEFTATHLDFLLYAEPEGWIFQALRNEGAEVQLLKAAGMGDYTWSK